MVSAVFLSSSLPGGTPTRHLAGHPVQMRGSLPGGNPVETLHLQFVWALARGGSTGTRSVIAEIRESRAGLSSGDSATIRSMIASDPLCQLCHGGGVAQLAEAVMRRAYRRGPWRCQPAR